MASLLIASMVPACSPDCDVPLLVLSFRIVKGLPSAPLTARCQAVISDSLKLMTADQADGSFFAVRSLILLVVGRFLATQTVRSPGHHPQPFQADILIA